VLGGGARRRPGRGSRRSAWNPGGDGGRYCAQARHRPRGDGRALPGARQCGRVPSNARTR